MPTLASKSEMSDQEFHFAMGVLLALSLVVPLLHWMVLYQPLYETRVLGGLHPVEIWIVINVGMLCSILPFVLLTVWASSLAAPVLRSRRCVVLAGMFPVGSLCLYLLSCVFALLVRLRM